MEISVKMRSEQKDYVLGLKMKIRQDKELPIFDAISEIEIDGPKNDFETYSNLAKKLTAGLGSFVDDVFRMKFESAEEIYIKLVKKGLAKYLQISGQEERFIRMTEKVICSCKQISDFEVLEVKEKYEIKNYEQLQKRCEVGLGCGSCEMRVKKLCDF